MYFVRVDLCVEAHILCRDQQPAALVDGKDSLFAENVAELGDSLSLYLRQHFADEYVVDKAVGIVLPFLRYGVRAHEGGNDVKRRLKADAAYHLEHLEFEVEVQSVAALDLDRRSSLGERRKGQLFRRFKELFPGRRLHGVDGGEDAAAALEYLKVGESGKAHAEFILAAFREAEVCVGRRSPV